MAGVKQEDLKLLGMNVSPFALRVRVALNIKGVSYEYLEQDLFHKSELLLSSNPVHRKVPVLIHGGRPVCESLVVVQHVDEVWTGAGNPILPADPYQRARARFWAAYIDDKLFPAWAAVMKAPTEEARAERLTEAHAVVQNLEDAFAERSDGTPFFSGDSVGLVDLALGCFLPWFAALRKMHGAEILDAGKSPRLAAWAERFARVPEVEEVMPETDDAVAYAQKLRAHYAAVANDRSLANPTEAASRSGRRAAAAGA